MRHLSDEQQEVHQGHEGLREQAVQGLRVDTLYGREEGHWQDEHEGLSKLRREGHAQPGGWPGEHTARGRRVRGHDDQAQERVKNELNSLLVR